jgi:hypothetical protein
VLYLRAETTTPKLYASGDALFTHLGLEHGGTATVTIDIRGGELRYTLHRPDGTTAGPAASAGLAGPGAGLPIGDVPEAYVDTPETAAATYVAAVNARDGRTLCGMFAREVRTRYVMNGLPCWATVATSIDFAGESAVRAFRSIRLFKIGTPAERAVGGHRYVGVPLTLDVRFRRAETASMSAQPILRMGVDDELWLEQDGERWRIAKPSLALMTAAAVVVSRDEDPLAPPGAG